MTQSKRHARNSEAGSETATGPIPLAITQRQKQALIDNLQLEVTERARKLRAQYALQAQSLQTRIELRINRIPTALRKITMGELMQRYEESLKPQPIAPTTKAAPAKLSAKNIPASTARTRAAASPGPIHRGIKRTSDVMDGEDKENTPDPSYDVSVPKKRSKTGANGDRRAHNPNNVLSPKSSNSRTLPHSPVRQPLGSSAKAASSRPASPLKGNSTTSLAGVIGGEKTRNTRPAASATTGRKPASKAAPSTASTRAKRGTAATSTAERTVSSGSNTSGTSTGTTIVKKASRGLLSANTGTKRTAATTTATRRAAPKAQAETASTAAKRSLRKRA